ncbi:unnamed protein product [Brachionus calyciflorus]|uniref:Eukaryotic translation initiation factor 5 n=1 Tax=Brachionus calyciflorus TaxID=104777 RepID=A0A813UK82_9BILA|nr:unnamed protein product [Brachionus calyciflorus]
MGDQMIPVLKDTKDPHYRYKMPKITAKIEGSGNGIKTVITNMTQVAKALDRPASYPTKYFGIELGAQVTMANDIYSVNGSHDADKLLSLLYSFIRKFVLCSKCNNPETHLTIVNGNIKQKCLACGYGTTIPKAIHKLTTYVINHPPNGGEKKTESKKSSKKSSKSSEKNVDDQGQEVKAQDNQDDFEDDFDDDALTSDAYVERLKEMTDGLKSGVYKTDSKESANKFYKIVKEKKDAGELTDVNVQKDLVKEAELLEIRDKSLLVLSELLFTENIIEEIKTYRMLLLRFCNQNRKSQKYLLGGFEKLVGDVYKDKLFDKSINILKQFYDQDILDEEVIIEWASKESKKYISKEMSKKLREKVAPLIKWLKEAEEESDEDDDEEEEKGKTSPVGQKDAKNQPDDDEDEDDDLLEFSHRVQGLQIETVKPSVPIKPVNEEVQNESNGHEDDIDIDNI